MKRSPKNRSHLGHTNHSDRLLAPLFSLYYSGQFNAAQMEAEKLLMNHPNLGLGWKVLGSLYQQQGQLDDAGKAFERAAALLPQDAEVFYDWGNVCFQQQSLTQALALYERSISIHPKFAKAHANLACVFKEQGKAKHAEKAFQQALKLDPNDAFVLSNLALLLHEAGKSNEAMQYYRRAYALMPEDAVLVFNMAQAFEDNSDNEQAIAFYQKAISLGETFDSHWTDASYNLALLYTKLAQFELAAATFETVLVRNPRHENTLENLVNLYKKMGRVRDFERCVLALQDIQHPDALKLNSIAAALINQHLYADAEKYCQQALAIKPDDANIYCNLALIANARNDFDEASRLFEQALAIEPNSFIVLTNYSVTLRMQGQLSKAKQVLEQSIALNPSFVGTYVNLSNIYLDLGDVPQAIQVVKRIFEFDENNLTAIQNILFYDSYANHLSAEEYMHYAHLYGQQVQALAQPYSAWNVHANDNRLRVGLVSGDLRQHPVGFFLKNWLSHVDAGRIEVYAYSTDGREDPFTHTLKNHCVQWRSLLAGHDDASAAKLIHDDGIHVLLDLSGHTGGNRLPVFAWKPAPVQAAWLGYWGTTGVAEMDAVIADVATLPKVAQQRFTEKIALLPHTRLCFAQPDVTIEVNTLPALSRGYLTLGCFQNFTKVSDAVLALWAQVMQEIPDAQLRWQCKAFSDSQIQQLALDKLAQHGISSARCQLFGKTTREAYLAAHHEIDFILDSFPFTGGTTTCEALWMGVPTLTLTGNTMIACQGASLLHAVGLENWVVNTQADYVNQAMYWAKHLNHLASLRQQLRQQVQASPLMQGAQFAQDFETLLFDLWHTHLTNATNHAHEAHQPLQELYQGNKPIWMVSATRMSEDDFWQNAALGRSLRRHMQQDQRIFPHITYENKRGLSELFNEAIEAAPDDAILVFIHDDVWLDQNTFAHELLQGLAEYDVIGLAGNKRRLPAQPGWLFVDIEYAWESGEFVSGSVAHGQDAFGVPTHFGPAPASCELMDGVFLAASKQNLCKHNVRFDPQFKFHFYDLDFCREARNAGLRLGVWPIAITHQSLGAFNSPAWKQTYLQYLAKWQETSFFESTGHIMETTLETQHETGTEAGLQDASQGISAVGLAPQMGNINPELANAVNEVMTQAKQFADAGDQAQALFMYQEVLKVAPQYAPALHAQGKLAQTSTDHDQALSYFEQAVMAMPTNADYWVSYIETLMQVATIEDVLYAIELAQQHGLSHEQAQALAELYMREYATPKSSADGTDLPTSQQTLATAREAHEVAGYVYHPEDNFYHRPQAQAFGYEDAGNAEQRLYQIVHNAKDRSVFSTEFAAQATDWASFYHLTPLRANLLRPFAERIANGKTLELGAGCGAVTRFIGELGGEVVALEGSANRARIIGHRCADLANVRIFSDLIQDFETSEKFDVVTLIGVLEYAQVYVKGDQPLQTLLKKAKAFLKEDGILIVAIENQLGLKYFCGAHEDHMGQAMYGINDAYGSNTPITFGKKELSELILSTGFAKTALYVPLPDYKTPVTIIYPEGFNQAHHALGWDVGTLAAGSAVHDRQAPRHPTFSLENAWRVIARNGLVEDMANSFLFVAYQQDETHPNQILAAHYGCQRTAAFSKETQFVLSEQQLQTHTRHTGDTKRLFDAPWHAESYQAGQLWFDVLQRQMNRPGWRTEQLSNWAKVWLDCLATMPAQAEASTLPSLKHFNTLLPAEAFDATPTNLIVDAQGQGHFFDLEWNFGFSLPFAFVALRGLFLTLHRVSSCAKPHVQTPMHIGNLTLEILAQHGLHYSDADLALFMNLFNRLQNQAQGLPEEMMNGLTQQFSTAQLPVRALFS